MATCAVSGSVKDTAGAAITTATVYARVVNPVMQGNVLIAPGQVLTTVDASGNFTLTLQQSVSVAILIQYPLNANEELQNLYYTALVPATVTASFSNIIVSEP